MKSKNKIHSISRQIAGIFVAILAFTIVVLWLVNTCFLGDFYIAEKKDAMKALYQSVNEAATNNQLEDDDFRLSIERSYANHNVSVVVMSSAGKIILSTTPDTREMFSQFLSATFQQGKIENDDVLASEENYFILRQVDRRLNEEYLVLCGTLDNGNLVMIRSAVESIRESSRLSNRFLLFVGGIALLMGMMAAIVLVNRITRPLRKLTDISKRMAQMDFDAKYESQEKRNEVDILGEHMNILSENLEKNILELKQANHELQADIAMKEERQRSQQEFVANVSHELKTPIAVIQGYAEGLAEGISDDAESREYYCDVIIDEAKKMNRMVLSLISLNQIESGNSQVTYEHFDIAEMISGVLLSMGLLFEQEGIHAVYEGDEHVLVYADQYLVEEVLTNYLSNALHYAKNEKEIIVRLSMEEKRVRISVFNTGDCINEENITRIWDKFYKVDKARTREYGGTGIGLSIVKAIMSNLHQECGVINRENGVEFWFTLER